MKYVVSTFREVGLMAKWSKTDSGTPIIIVKDAEMESWRTCDKTMFDNMKKLGIKKGFYATEDYQALNKFF
jgi:hypothetical protein